MGGKKFDGTRTSAVEVFSPKSGISIRLKEGMPKSKSGFSTVNAGKG
jgi:hypothetical protein